MKIIERGNGFVLPLRLGGIAIDMPLTRYEAADRLPADKSFCYADQGAGRFVAAIYKGGRWLDRKSRPLPSVPTVWFKLGGGD